MPRVNVLVRIRITGWAFVRQGVNLKADPPNAQQLSPYNPPVRFLAEEMSQLHPTAGLPTGTGPGVPLHVVGATQVTPSMATFRFRADQDVQFRPGQYVVLDFSQDETALHGYRHMNEDDPRALNEDFLRTFTISSACPYVRGAAPDGKSSVDTASTKPGVADSKCYFACTIKRVPGGRVSSLLHQRMKHQQLDRITVRLVAVQGSFTPFDRAGELQYQNMMWFAAGSGVTPFVSMWTSLQQQVARGDRRALPRIHLFFSSRSPAELAWARAVFMQLPRAQMHLFSTAKGASGHAIITDDDPLPVQQRRMRAEDVRAAALGMTGLPKGTAAAFVCGPTGFTHTVDAALEQAGLSPEQILHESFRF